MNFKNKIKQLPFLAKIGETADSLGIKIYFVGGFVRDIILEREKSEIDFLVIGDGIEFAKKLAREFGQNNVSVFKNFGTAHFKYEGYDLEFVGARKESYSKDSRNPIIESANFTDDINRRDFTINTLAVSLNSETFGELKDNFNGLQDIENKIIRTPLDPNQTFDDDPLRILRAMRFASQLNFEVTDEIIEASQKLKKRLSIISQERITDEFLKIMSSDKPSIGLYLLKQSEVLEVIFPEIDRLSGVDKKNDFLHKDVFKHTLRVVDNISKVTDNVWLRFAALVHDIAKPRTKKFDEQIGWTFHGHEELGARMMKSIFTRLKLPFSKKNYVEKLVRFHLRPIALVNQEVSDSAIRRFIVALDEDLDDLITLCRADITSKNMARVNQYLSNYEKVMNKVKDVKEKDELRAFQSPVSGEVIMSICNLKPSKKVGLIKKEIEEAILDGKIKNNYDSAFEYLLKIKDSF